MSEAIWNDDEIGAIARQVVSKLKTNSKWNQVHIGDAQILFVLSGTNAVQRTYLLLTRMQSTADAVARKVASNLKANLPFKEV